MILNTSLPWQREPRLNTRTGRQAGREGEKRKDAEKEGVTSGVRPKSE